MATLKKNVKIKFRSEPEYLFVRELLRKYKTNLQDFSVKAISEAIQHLVNKYEADRIAREAAKKLGENNEGSSTAQFEPVDGPIQPSGDINSAVLANTADVPAESTPGP